MIFLCCFQLSKLLKSPCKSIDYFFNSFNFCLMYFKILLLSTYIIEFVMSSKWIDPFYHYKIFLWCLLILCLNVYFVYNFFSLSTGRKFKKKKQKLKVFHFQECLVLSGKITSSQTCLTAYWCSNSKGSKTEKFWQTKGG